MDGPPLTSDSGQSSSIFGKLCAENAPDKGAARFRVGPCILGFISSITAGPYWVVGLGVDEVAKDYSWAIVSGGQPQEFIEEKNGRNFCTTSNSTCALDQPETGLWLLTRERVASQRTLDEIFATLDTLGYYTGYLKDVQHAGCTYPSNVKL